MKKIALSLLFFIHLFWGCSQPEPKNIPEILATVGDAIITKEDFLLNYEFGFAHQKIGENSKKTYLDHMITELLLATEGYAQSIDTSSTIRFAVQSIREERIIEEVFNTFVVDKITVTEDEIRAEIEKAAVSFQLTFVPAQSENQARLLQARIANEGLDSVLISLETEMSSETPKPTDFTTPFLKAENIDLELLDQIKDLKLNELSEPISFNGQWVLIQVRDIKRSPLAPDDYVAKMETYYKVLFNKKAMQGAEVFIEKTMTPLNVRTKQSAFRPLAVAFQKWYRVEIPTFDLTGKVTKGTSDYHSEICHILQRELVEFGNSKWTVADFLKHFNPALYQLRPDESQRDFALQFADVVALVVRDYELKKMAEKADIIQNENVQKDIRQWQDKWVFQAMRERELNKIPFTKDDVIDFYFSKEGQFVFQDIPFEELNEIQLRRVRKDYLNYRLKQKAKLLANTYKVTVYEDKLADIEVSKSTKNPYMQVQLFKQNSNRLAFPVVDPNW